MSAAAEALPRFQHSGLGLVSGIHWGDGWNVSPAGKGGTTVCTKNKFFAHVK